MKSKDFIDELCKEYAKNNTENDGSRYDNLKYRTSYYSFDYGFRKCLKLSVEDFIKYKEKYGK